MTKKRSRSESDPPARAEVSRAAPPRWPAVLGAAMLIAATALAYYPCLHGEFIYDDTALLTHNPLIKASDGLYRFWFTAQAIDYWPVFNSALWFEWRVWEMNPAGYHATNVALHIVNALLLWVVLQRLFVPGALLAALLFALHPVNVESVAWIAQLKGLLAMFFSLLSVLLYLKSEAPPPPRASSSARRASRWYGLSLAIFVLAMLSKGSAVVLPGLLLVILWWRRPLKRSDFIRVAPFVTVAAAFIPLNMWFRTRFGTGAPSAPLIDHLLGGAAALWFYAYKALLPFQLSFLYPKWQVRADEVQWWLPLIAVIAFTGVIWRRRGATRPILFAWTFFVVSLAPALALSGAGLMEEFSVADHYLYFAVIGVVALLASAGAAGQAGVRTRWLANAGMAALAVLFAFLTWQQSGLYRDAITLYEASLRTSPDSALAHHNLAIALYDSSRLDEAEREFAEALRLNPNYDQAHEKWGLTLLRAGKLPEAVAHFDLALKARPANALYRYEIGAALAAAHQLEAAIAHLREAIQLIPNYAEAHNDLGSALLEVGQTEEATMHFEQAVRLAPDLAEALQNLGRARLHAGKFEDAVDLFRKALSLNPRLPHLHNDLGVALAETHRRQEAIEQFEEALRADPNDQEARANLDEVLVTKE